MSTSNQSVAFSFIAIVIAVFLLNFAITDAPAILGLVTANTILWNKYIWNLVTSSFYEESIWKLILDLACLFIVLPTSKIISYEPISQFVLYVFVCVILSSLATSTYCLIRFFSTGREAMILEPVYGCAGVIVTLAMYCRKMLGNTPIISPILNIGGRTGVEDTDGSADNYNMFFRLLMNVTYNNFPILIIATLLIFWLIGQRWLALDTVFAICSLLISWSYLRFFYCDAVLGSEGGSYGTPEPEFRFVLMFPESVHIVVAPLATSFYNLVTLTGLFPPLPPSLPLSSLDGHASHTPHHTLGGSYLTELSKINTDKEGDSQEKEQHRNPTVDPVMERRKAKAQQLLNARISELSSNNTSSVSLSGAGNNSSSISSSGDDVVCVGISAKLAEA